MWLSQNVHNRLDTWYFVIGHWLSARSVDGCLCLAHEAADWHVFKKHTGQYFCSAFCIVCNPHSTHVHTHKRMHSSLVCLLHNYKEPHVYPPFPLQETIPSIIIVILSSQTTITMLKLTVNRCVHRIVVQKLIFSLIVKQVHLLWVKRHIHHFLSIFSAKDSMI